MKTGQGIKLLHGFEIVEIQAHRHVYLERKKMERIKAIEETDPFGQGEVYKF